MLKLKAVLEVWIKVHYRHVPKDFASVLDGTADSSAVEGVNESGSDLHRAKTTRKRRTNIDNQQKFILEDFFQNSSRPSASSIKSLSNDLSLPREINVVFFEMKIGKN